MHRRLRQQILRRPLGFIGVPYTEPSQIAVPKAMRDRVEGVAAQETGSYHPDQGPAYQTNTGDWPRQLVVDFEHVFSSAGPHGPAPCNLIRPPGNYPEGGPIPCHSGNLIIQRSQGSPLQSPCSDE